MQNITLISLRTASTAFLLRSLLTLLSLKGYEENEAGRLAYSNTVNLSNLVILAVSERLTYIFLHEIGKGFLSLIDYRNRTF